MTHHVLDEIWSLDFQSRAELRVLKKSFGTALQIFGQTNWWEHLVWASSACCSLISLGRSRILDRLRQRVDLDR